MPRNFAINGDCLQAMQYVPDKSINLIVADLPFGMTKNHWDSIIPYDQLWLSYNRIIKDDGAIILFAKGTFAAKLMVSNEKYFRQELIWKKGNKGSDFLNANRRPLSNHENILVFYKNLPTYNPQFTTGQPLHSKGTAYLNKKGTNNNYGEYSQVADIRKGSTDKYPLSVLNFDPVPPAKKGVERHPTEKPVALLEWLIRTYSKEGDIILDNVAGSGSTGIAAQNTGRNFILIEKERSYFHNILRKLLFPIVPEKQKCSVIMIPERNNGHHYFLKM